MTMQEDSSDHDDQEDRPETRKRPRKPASDPRYPRKRSSRACHVCRARKTKCDNVHPTCGFCAALSIRCSYDAGDKDHSSFDPASLEILRQLGQIASVQDDLVHMVRSGAASMPQQQQQQMSWNGPGDVPPMQHAAPPPLDWSITGLSPEAATTTSPAASAGVAAVRWFGLLANDVSREAVQEADGPLGPDGLLDITGDDEAASPLQLATRIIDGQPGQDEGVTPGGLSGADLSQESLWQASESIHLLPQEQQLFEHFLHRICSWLDLFDPARTFSALVPHLALRNAGLLNAIMALASYHRSLDDENTSPEAAAGRPARSNRSSALQYYYQTLHYVQKAMRHTTYSNSRELMATTLIVSTYEMLRGARDDWQQHLQGVFWILRSRQIEVEQPSLESTTWWAWLRQDIWVAFRERRRTYSTWAPKKACAALGGYELASRSVWLLAQVVNFCALDAAAEGGRTEGAVVGERMAWARALRGMLAEWRDNLTVEFSPLPTSSGAGEEQVFRPRLIYPQCFGLAMQVHHVSQILIAAHEPSLGGIDGFMERQRVIQEGIEVVCGIGMTLTEDASSILSSQCLFIAGMFMQDQRKRACVLEMLEVCRTKCAWPTPSLGSELDQVWRDQQAGRLGAERRAGQLVSDVT